MLTAFSKLEGARLSAQLASENPTDATLIPSSGFEGL